MRRLFHILLTAVTVISLLLAFATIMFWVRSKLFISDALVYYTLDVHQRTDAEVSFQSLDGAVAFRWLTRDRSGSMPPPRQDMFEGLYYASQQIQPSAISYDSLRKRLGFHFVLPVPQRFEAGVVALPHWLLLVLFLLLPLLALRAGCRSFYRRRHHLCPTCGYDLRASPNQCPECGLSPKGAAA